MAPTEPYRGAISLASSKYASPSATRKAFTTMPSAVSPVTKAPVNTAGASNAIATKEQVAAAAKDVTTHTPYNADAQLAMAQDEALKDEVEKHSAKFAKSVSSAVSNTRRLLTLIRDSVKEGGDEASASLKSVDTLWQELEQLFEAAQNAKSALPDFLEKQKGNMSLYHNSVINETIRETQDELNLQHKKVNIQHSLILERQQAFLDHKAQTDAKLKEFTELQERVSRLTLDKGLLRTELDNVQQHLDEERKGKAEGLQKAGSLKKEVEALEATKEKLATEGDTLRATISDLQDKVKAAEHKATDHYEKEIRRVGEQLAKEQHKATALDTLVKALQKGDNSAKKEVEKLRTEQKLLQDKYNHQSAEYSKAFTNLNEQTKKANALAADVERFGKQNGDLKKRLATLDKLEIEASELRRAKTDLQGKLDKLQGEIKGAMEAIIHARNEVETLTEKLKKAEKENDELEEENNNLMAKQAEHKKVSAAFSILKGENAKLLATVQGLQSKPAAPVAGDSATLATTRKEIEGLQNRLSEAENEKTRLEKALGEWTDLAKRSYKEYKDMLPLYKQADQLRKENDELKQKLSGQGPSAQSNGVADGEVAYWKNRYETLLANMD